MPAADVNGISIAYEDHGNAGDPVVLMIMGLGAQLTLWPIELVEALVARGFRVIRHDNRDIGLSTKFAAHAVPSIGAIVMARMVRRQVRVPYSLTDMAGDAVGLLDALGIARAHVVGASLGGMIAQLMAVEFPERVLSLTSIMSTTGNPWLRSGNRETMRVITRRPTSDDEETMIEFGALARRTVGSPAYPEDEAAVRERVRSDLRRSSDRSGVPRQLAAALADGDRRKRLATIRVPTLVIHGADDPLIPAAAGRDTARAILGAELKIVPGMGHNLPIELADEFADAIAALAAGAAVP